FFYGEALHPTNCTATETDPETGARFAPGYGPPELVLPDGLYGRSGNAAGRTAKRNPDHRWPFYDASPGGGPRPSGVNAERRTRSELRGAAQETQPAGGGFRTRSADRGGTGSAQEGRGKGNTVQGSFPAG